VRLRDLRKKSKGGRWNQKWKRCTREPRRWETLEIENWGLKETRKP